MIYKGKKFKTILEGNPTTFHHFKGHDYQIICIGKDSEDEKDTVVYQNVITKEIWIRKAEMFFSNVDKNKYPNVKQIERFKIL